MRDRLYEGDRGMTFAWRLWCWFATGIALMTILSWLTGCAQVASFEQRAAPVVARACADFRKAEASPLIRAGVAAGSMIASAETGGVAGPAIGAAVQFGDAYCTNGPPAGDTTTPAQQAAWLAGVTQQVLAGQKQQ